MSEGDAARARESRDALERVRRESESVGTSALARAGRRLSDHLSARDAVGDAEHGGTDPVELWGRRVGRALSVIGALVLAWYLGVQLRLW